MEAEGIDVDEYVFYPDGDETTTKFEEKNETSQTVTSTDLNMILAAISAQTATMSSQLEEQKTYMSSQMESQETRITSKMEKQLESQENRITAKIESQEARISEMSSEITSKIEAQEARISEMSTQISAQVSSQISAPLESRMEEKLTQFQEGFSGRQDKMEAEIDALKDRIQEFQLNRPITSTSTLKVKSPTFDGSVPFQVFKLQF
ncbi:golgin subfamily A member 1-like [Eurosta solidaginis]|uniref:golgin subfamily A member 1-like n=1 Tax=Eurosta solidaginis TaxID=178769 RepID=UPI0035317AA8